MTLPLDLNHVGEHSVCVLKLACNFHYLLGALDPVCGFTELHASPAGHAWYYLLLCFEHILSNASVRC